MGENTSPHMENGKYSSVIPLSHHHLLTWMPQESTYQQWTGLRRKDIQIVMPEMGVRQYSAATYQPANNGVAKRKIGTLKRSMEKIVNEDMLNWKEYFCLAVMAIK